MARKPAFRPSLAEKRRINQASLDYYRAISAQPDAPRVDVGAKAKRERSPTGEDTEAPVAQAIAQLLAHHPLVAMAERRNRGMAFNANGAPIRFARTIRGVDMVCDFEGWLKNCKPFVIEAKRPGWEQTFGDSELAQREAKQAQRIAQAIALGGVGGFARSVDEAIAILHR